MYKKGISEPEKKRQKANRNCFIIYINLFVISFSMLYKTHTHKKTIDNPPQKNMRN